MKERAFAAYRRCGGTVEAADTARWLALLYATFHGNFARRADGSHGPESLLEGVDECAAHGWVMLDWEPSSRDLPEREQFAASVLAIARRFGDAELEFDALALFGETFVASGRVAQGNEVLD